MKPCVTEKQRAKKDEESERIFVVNLITIINHMEHENRFYHVWMYMSVCVLVFALNIVLGDW